MPTIVRPAGSFDAPPVNASSNCRNRTVRSEPGSTPSAPNAANSSTWAPGWMPTTGFPAGPMRNPRDPSRKTPPCPTGPQNRRPLQTIPRPSLSLRGCSDGAISVPARKTPSPRCHVSPGKRHQTAFGLPCSPTKSSGRDDNRAVTCSGHWMLPAGSCES
jgi:hypothetical protein